MIEIKFKCEKCGCERGRISVNIHFEFYVECEECEEIEVY